MSLSSQSSADEPERRARKRSITRSVRIEQDIDRALEELSGRERVSVNVLVNDGLRKYVEWDVNARKFGITLLPVAAAKKLLDYLSEEEIIDFAKWVAQNVFKEYVMFWFKKINLANVVRAIRLLGTAGNYEFEEGTSRDTGTIICKHNSGPKWSLFYEETFRRAFEELAKTKAKLESTEDQVMVQFPTPRELFLEGVLRELETSTKGR